MKLLKIFIVLLLTAFISVSGQVFPVRTLTTVASPYPASLDQYASTENGNISLTIIPSDASLQNYPVKLRMVISGGWFKIYTNPSFIHKNITLNSGEPMVFTGPELAQWFNPDNLIFEGYSKAQYLKTGRLPEGVYQIWFEVWDYYRNFNISGTSKAMVWSFENEAPLLNFPEKDKQLGASDPQNIVFNWTQKQSPYSTAGAGNKFTFELWEIWPDNMSVDEAVKTTRPIYSSEVTSTILNYTTANPILLTGRKYAWRVKVSDPLGRSQFKNDGYSEVRWFRFGKDCTAAKPALDKATTQSLAVKWDNNTNIDRYELRWRNLDIENGNWYTKEITGISATIDKLNANTKYELQLKGYCDAQESSYSSSLNASTLQDLASNCGGAAGSSPLTNTDPLSSLRKGSIIHASDFDVLVTSASGIDGTFSGKGYLLVPYLKFIRFEVTFSGIHLNTNHQLTSGEINFVYNEKRGAVLNVGAFISSISSANNDKPVGTNPYTSVADKKIVSDTTVSKIDITPAGDVIVTDVNGNKQVVHTSSGEMVAVSTASGEGEQSVVDTKTKTIYKGTAETKSSNGGSSSPLQPVTSDTAQYTVTFMPHAQQQYGLDLPGGTHPAGNYSSTTIGGKEYLIPWKSVETGHIDRLEATVTGGPADSVNFVTSNGNLVLTAPGSSLSSNSADASKQLLVSGADASDELKAWYAEYENADGDSAATQKRILAGQANVVAYDKITRTVCLVQLNHSTVPDAAEVQRLLNQIYATSVVEWKVQSASLNDISYDLNGNGMLDIAEENDAMSYTDEEKKINAAIKNLNSYNSDALYLVFADKFTPSSINGYMPFNRQFGYICKGSQNPVQLIHTIAHELGHGAFRLRHTFSNKNTYIQSQGTTDNLMDYAAGNQLLKYQWDITRKWHLGINWFESGTEAENYDGIFFTPAWKPFTFTHDYKLTPTTSKSDAAPTGTIKSLLYNNQKYEASFDSNNTFINYTNSNGDILPNFTNYNNSITNDEVVFLVDYVGSSCANKVYSIKYSNLNKFKANASFDDKTIIIRNYTATCQDNNSSTTSITEDDFSVQQSLRILRLMQTRKAPYTFTQGYSAANIKIGNNTYSSVIIQPVESTGRTYVSSNYLIFDNVKVTVGKDEEVENMRKFISGEEKNIYGSSGKSVNLNGEAITFDLVCQKMEDVLVTILNKGSYDKLTKAQQIALNVPIIEWVKGYPYGSAIFYHWFSGTGFQIKLTDENYKELFENSSFFKQHLQATIKEIENNEIYNVDYADTCLSHIKSTILSLQNNTTVSYCQDYKMEKTQHSIDYKCLFKSHVVSFKQEIEITNSIIDDDLAYAIGSFAILVNLSGDLKVLGIDRGYIKASGIVYRINDNFDFVGDQRLGNWNGNIFDSKTPSILLTNTTLHNSDLRGLYELISDSKVENQTTKWDFKVTTKYYNLDTKIRGIDYSIDAFGNIKGSVFK